MIALLLITNLLAQDVLIQSESTPDLLYQKQLIAQPQAVSYIQFKAEPQSSTELELKELFKRAQFEFLKGSLQKANQFFEQIANHQHTQIWSENSQQLIFTSMLRVAQLSQPKGDRWLKRAILFNPDIHIDENLFPPPMVTKFKAQKKSMGLQVWPLPRGAGSFARVLVNGRSQSLNGSFIRYRSGRVRLDFLSNKLQAQSHVVDLNKLDSLILTRQPLATGSCRTPEYQVDNLATASLQLVDGKCLSGPIKQNSVALPPMDSPNKPDGPNRSAKFLGNKWFWIGASVLATGLAVHSANQRGDQGAHGVPASKGPQKFTNN